MIEKALGLKNIHQATGWQSQKNNTGEYQKSGGYEGTKSRREHINKVSAARG